MTITIENNEETLSLEVASEDINIYDFKELIIRIAAGLGYTQSSVDECFGGKNETND
ncbi:MAG: hypothetical protein H8E12_17110 [Rhodobacteraceae bacterium]|nr:hypothetical protein [Paracoccaceae bacterium]